MKRTIIALSALTFATAGLAGCQSNEEAANAAFFPSSATVVPNERIYLADFGPMPSQSQPTFYLGAGDSLGAACFARYLASIDPNYGMEPTFRYVTVPTDAGRPD